MMHYSACLKTQCTLCLTNKKKRSLKSSEPVYKKKESQLRYGLKYHQHLPAFFALSSQPFDFISPSRTRVVNFMQP